MIRLGRISHVGVVQRDSRRPGLWSLAALALSAAGVAAIVVLIATADRVDGVFVPLVAAPLAISLAPVLVPRRALRIAAAVLLGLWCILAGLLTTGFLLLPALVAQAGAAIRETE